MEKTVVFLPMIIFGGFFLLLVVGFFVLVFKLVKKGRDSAWKGKLVEKKYVEGEDFDTDRKTDYFTLIFETDEGKQIKVGVDRQTYDEYKIGDQAEKRKGEFRPRKL
ncbi:hypothetical protein COT03_02805 [Candidatus Shapirobacteria bacterium CG07_land_8_20_14_0_80_39_18]|uniref:DUF7489 domain-containing protein n=1 Tax=Candidatus Shapirobacteria bacterium CG07_land_8_20_14_0_80_39_18 TaxID=1974882 RepID=A0A2M6YQR1_9BACT|nr:MAG: hypothetical protein COT03_02805 [Candidatus Shapirobacteria bacterium CG07_land_8_20_14_0_80_39_18]